MDKLKQKWDGFSTGEKKATKLFAFIAVSIAAVGITAFFDAALAGTLASGIVIGFFGVMVLWLIGLLIYALWVIVASIFDHGF
jgi:hypothetical protein